MSDSWPQEENFGNLSIMPTVNKQYPANICSKSTIKKKKKGKEYVQS